MRVVLRLRLLQTRRALRRWLRGLIEDRSLVLLYLAAFGGGAAWAYSTFPSQLSEIVRTSSYPIAATAARIGLVLLLVLIWRQIVLGLRYPPFVLSRGDISMLLVGPIDRRTIVAFRLVRAYASAGLTLAVPMILLGPFMVRIWNGLTPTDLAVVWLHLSIGWIALIHWRWGVFHDRRLKRVARSIRWTGYGIAGAGLLALFVAWAVGRFAPPISAGEATLAAGPAWTFPRLGAWSLGILAAIAVASWGAVWRAIPHVSLEGLVQISLAVSDGLAQRRGKRGEELEQSAARVRRTRARRGGRRTIAYRVGTKAITGRATAMALRQSPVAVLFTIAVFVGTLFVFIHMPILWGKALILSVVATSIAKFPLASLYRDVRNWTFARQLPFSEVEWVDGNAAVLWVWQTALGWIFLLALSGLGTIAPIDLLPSMAFLAAAGHLVAHQTLLTLFVEARANRLQVLGVRIGCLGAFALLAGVVVALRATPLPSWSPWFASGIVGFVLARVWRRFALRAVRELIDRPWEVAPGF